jgi:hypothetical protein
MPNQFRRVGVIVLMLGLSSASSLADEVVVKMNRISEKGVGEAIGTIVVMDAHHGVTIRPNLKGLPPGKHAFHIPENPDCGPGRREGSLVGPQPAATLPCSCASCAFLATRFEGSLKLETHGSTELECVQLRNVEANSPHGPNG